MKLSVIIPAYRVEKTLSKCVHSITEMSFSDYELILVDDCSPDRTGSICDELAKENRRIHVIHKNKNEGLSQARNEGIEQAQGEYVTFIDSDDYLKKGTFDELISLINDHPEYDIIEYPSYLHYGSDRQKMLMFSPCEYTDKRDYWYDCHAYEHTYAWNKIYKTCLFNSIRFPVGMVSEDVYTLPMLLKKAKKVATTDLGLYYYCENPKGITSTAGGKELKNLLDAHIKYINENAIEEDKSSNRFARYYAHILNIQLDVYEQTDEDPLLPVFKVKSQSIKLFLLNIIGIKRLCKLNKGIHKFIKPHQ